MKPSLHPGSVLAGATLATTCVLALGMQRAAGPFHASPLTSADREILDHLSIVYLDDGQGGLAKTLRVTGVNLQVVNGLGATNGYPSDPESVDPLVTATDGTGNLIVGYNEPRHPIHGPNDRTGSHNLIVGQQQNYPSFGGQAAGVRSVIDGVYATVGGGLENRACGAYASVGAGWVNTAGGMLSSVAGGRSNYAGGDYSSVTGGSVNSALGPQSAICGGDSNQATGIGSSIAGGGSNQATGRDAAICGGRFNVGSGDYGCVSGGTSREVSGEHDWRAGDLFQDD